MANISHKLKNSFEGALAGGGDPATSPLYVFGPFLKLVVIAGVAEITFGASIWMVVITIAVVSAMYRLVMQWVTDGSGGSGLSEEEFGSWAVKVNAAITFIEYTLTFLVSMAAMVTFIADRAPILNEKIFWVQYRTIIAIILSILTGWLVNRGPKVAARTFGPATLGVLILLWVMVISTILKFGFHLPSFNLEAFSAVNFKYTLGGYVRILAVMTGIEVFANLVAAYDGTPAQKSNKAFKSLLIIMGTTGVTMLVVGPAIFQLADPSNTEVSVFTQTMDQLLPAPLPLIGTLVGVAVLMSASAASAQGLQNLALGLKERRYLPPVLGEQNQYEVADKPVWIEVSIVTIVFLFFGTHEETYLAIYAAGVFILLSMTGWAVTKRLIRRMSKNFKFSDAGLIIGTIAASLLTSAATLIIFQERFFEGAWTYFLFIPMLFAIFSYFRSRLGEPSQEIDYLGRFNASQLAGFGFGQGYGTGAANGNGSIEEISWQPEPIEKSHWREERIELKNIGVLLDSSEYAAQAIPYARKICKSTGAKLLIISSIKNHTQSLQNQYEANHKKRTDYVNSVAEKFVQSGISTKSYIGAGFLADVTKKMVAEKGLDLVITSTRGKSGNKHWLSGGVSSKLVRNLSVPVLLVQVEDPLNGQEVECKFEEILVALDGSINSERSLPYARAFAKAMNSQLKLLAVPAVPEAENYRAAPTVRSIRIKTVSNMKNFLDSVARSLRDDGLEVQTITKGSLPVRTIVDLGENKKVNMIMLTTRGRGGLDLLLMGSVAQSVVAQSSKAVFMIPIHNE